MRRSSSTRRTYDVIIVGMGPAGASAALELSRAGLSVLALEKESHPRYKVCGGGLSARIAPFLPEDFSITVERTVSRVHFLYGCAEPFVIESSRPIAYMVMRDTFDRWLVEKARQAGAVIREGEPVESLQVESSGVEVVSARERYEGQVLIGADGATGVVARQVFPHRRRRAIPAVEGELVLDDAIDSRTGETAVISLSAVKKGYGWIFPKNSGLSIGVGEFARGAQRLKRRFREFCQEMPMSAIGPIPIPRGHPIPVCRRQHPKHWRGELVNRRALLVGDAGGLVDPLLGEGIYYAVRSGRLAAVAILEMLRDPARRLEEYEEMIIREFGTEFRIAARLSRWIYGLPRSWHRWAGSRYPNAYRRVLERYCQVLQGEETYQSLWLLMVRKLAGPFAPRTNA